ncbi:serine--tRNA ligase [Deinococcus deserti]|uniref:Serine--tRNA ligase n=1 Tax=Deinococcus deserti (strain DSM 17065 / CIP 109153 / LMG 22923 / VCD115) TaxID=546414 RepID=C1D0J8_DEIDV|nr:serine--tRNA ligase [Deinococcus deserti]ACO45372.1 putative serine--tRNA ligase (Seryl-tRNA synthetase) [Deinococcus deserti VCD115]
MLDLRFIRENAGVVRRAIEVKGVNLDLDELLALDRELTAQKQRVEAMQAERNANAKLVPKATPAERPALIQKGKDLGDELKAQEPALRAQEEQLRQLLLRVPNIPHPGVPVGKDDTDNVELRREGQVPVFSTPPLDHVELLEKQGWSDPERVARVSGSRSYLLKGEAVMLEMAVLTFALDFLSARGFTPLSTTALARPETFVGSGHFPGGEDQVYKIDGDELMLAGTAEVPVNSLYAGEQLPLDALPVTYAAISAAFRSEAGSAGRDVRGLIRVHEFRKVEQYVMCRADEAEALQWFETLLANAEGLLQALELPYRVVQNCTGDMGAGKVLMYDIETWVPSEEKYRETHSCSYLGDWQARRTGLRYRDEEGRLVYAHTLNNTGIAAPRILVPLLENHQLADGRIRIPQALRPYLGGKEVIGQAVR